MPGMYSVRNLNASNPGVQEMANVCWSEDGRERRADANETGIVADALTTVALDAITYDYPELVFRQLAPLQEGLSPGTETYQWEEIDVTGMAKVIANYGDDLPNVAHYIKSNRGIIRSIGAATEYTKQDVRRVIEARRQGRGAVLDVDRVAQVREMIERKKDYIAAYGDTTYSLPGVLKNSNVTVVSAAAPASGSSKRWDGVDKIGTEMLKDLRAGLTAIRTTSKGIHRATAVIMPIEFAEAISMKPLITSSENQITVLEQFTRSQADMGYPVRIIPWQRCSTADANGTGPRVMFLEISPRVLRLVEPLDFEADAPQRVSLTFKIPCESRYGGIFFKRPLGALYMDFI